ncbi:hypothetical protein MH215_10160 [Paenibacillus sp. ACRSA]|uniref:hypothetical protein n=1 Tax=Paenibacillus sp. ACRSA TaxID=2918211 RepID=UPI001EF530D5|nr:hypothetical protein [Paenibacillus sp. ACRSA]MCG7377359.1 hypothetical protein [Paenibacillus sp. ACRSA]
MKKKYNVVIGCGNPECSNKKYKHVINTITYDAARATALQLRKELNPVNKCPNCRRQLGYYAIISEKNENTKRPTQIM